MWGPPADSLTCTDIFQGLGGVLADTLEPDISTPRAHQGPQQLPTDSATSLFKELLLPQTQSFKASLTVPKTILLL